MKKKKERGAIVTASNKRKKRLVEFEYHYFLKVDGGEEGKLGLRETCENGDT